MVPSKKTKRSFPTLNSKEPSIEKSPLSYWKMKPSFSFRKYDSGMSWALPMQGKPDADIVFSHLHDISSMTWSEVLQASGGRSRGTNSHGVPIAKLCKEVKQRADRINLNEDNILSLRLQGKVRLWGIIEPENGCFFVIWYDPDHKVYPLSK